MSTWKLWKHQVEAINKASTHNGFGFFMDMGTGKTIVGIEMIALHRMHRVLIVVPARTLLDKIWEKDITHVNNRYMGDGKEAPINHIVVSLTDGTSDEKADLLKYTDWSKPTIVVVSAESAWRGKLGVALKRIKWDGVLLDEAHKIKNPSSKISIFMHNFSRSGRSTYRYAFTGTPFHGGFLSAYSILKFLDPSIHPYSYGTFKLKYGIWGGFNNYQLIGHKNLDDLVQGVSNISYSFSIDSFKNDDEYPDIPDIVHGYLKADLSLDVKKIYKELNKNSIYTVDPTMDIVCDNTLVKFLRLHQLCSGDLTNGFQSRIVHNPKKELLSDALDELMKADGTIRPAVVFYRYVRDLQVIGEVCKSKGISYLTLSDIDRWRNGDADILAVQIQSGSVSLDMTRAKAIIYYNKSYHYADYVQSIARVKRPSRDQKVRHPILIIHLVVNGTVDMDIEKAFEKKQDLLEYMESLEK